MAKFSSHSRLSQEEMQNLFIDFAKAIASLYNPVEAAQLIKDLLSEPEAIMIARRLQVANLLLKGFTYKQICKAVKISEPTIANVQTWLRTNGEGYKMVIERTQKTNEVRTGDLNWRSLKKKYPLYFWPQILLKEIVKSANQRERKRLLDVIGKLKEKTKLTNELRQLLLQNNT